MFVVGGEGSRASRAELFEGSFRVSAQKEIKILVVKLNKGLKAIGKEKLTWPRAEPLPWGLGTGQRVGFLRQWRSWS